MGNNDIPAPVRSMHLCLPSFSCLIVPLYLSGIRFIIFIFFSFLYIKSSVLVLNGLLQSSFIKHTFLLLNTTFTTFSSFLTSSCLTDVNVAEEIRSSSSSSLIQPIYPICNIFSIFSIFFFFFWVQQSSDRAERPDRSLPPLQPSPKSGMSASWKLCSSPREVTEMLRRLVSWFFIFRPSRELSDKCEFWELDLDLFVSWITGSSIKLSRRSYSMSIDFLDCFLVRVRFLIESGEVSFFSFDWPRRFHFEMGSSLLVWQ